MYDFTNVDPVKCCAWLVLPTVYDESLSYGEQLNKFCKALNELIENNNNLPDYVAEMIQNYITSGSIDEVVRNILANYILNVKYPPKGIAPAVGDGSADDTDAIQGCIDYAFNKGGGCVYFPYGKYLSRSLTLRSGVSLVGFDRYSTRIVQRGGDTKPLVSGGNVQNVQITNLTLDGNNEVQTDDLDVINVLGKDCLFTNLVIKSGFQCFVYNGLGGDLQVDNVVFGGAVKKVAVINGKDSVQFTNVKFNELGKVQGECVLEVGASDGVYSFSSKAISPLCISVSGSRNTFNCDIINSTNNFTDSGILNNFNIFGVEVKEQLAKEKSYTGGSIRENITGNKSVVASGDTSENITGGKIEVIGGSKSETITENKTENITGNREIDIDGTDSVNVDGVSTFNAGGTRTEVYGSSLDVSVTGTFTENYKNTAKSIYYGKRILEIPDLTCNMNNAEIDTSNAVINYNNFKFIKNNKTFNIDDVYTLNMKMYGCDNTGAISINDLLLSAVNSGMTLFFPSGKYLIDSKITLPGNIRMFGINATFVFGENGCIILAEAENGYINNITFDGKSIAKNGIIIDTNAAGVVIENCTFLNFTDISVKIGDKTASGGHQWLINCKIYNPNTLATCLLVLHPDIKIIGCEFYYTKLAIELSASILFVTTSHLWSGGAKMNEFNNDVGISCNTYAQLMLDNVYLDSFTVGVKGKANLLINAKNIYLYYDNERTYKTNYVIGFLFKTWSKYNIDYIASKSANVSIYPISFEELIDFVNSEPELYLKNERSLANEYIEKLSTATNTANHQNRTALFKGQVTDTNTWYHVGWIIPNNNSWVRLDLSDGKYTASINMYFDRARTTSNIDTSKNTTNSEIWDIGIGLMETVNIAGQDIQAYPIFMKSVLNAIYYSVIARNYNTTWISIFNGVNDKTFKPLFTINHV